MSRNGVGEGRPWRRRLAFLADRTVVLFMGVGVGAAITLAFLGGGVTRADRGRASPPAPRPAEPATPPAACPAPIPPDLARKVALGQPVTIGVFGDSFGDGVWAALYRRLAKDNVKVLRLSEEGTGFTRYQVVNLEEKAAAQLEAQPVDIAVVVTGANDTEGTWDDAHAHAYALMTPKWKAVYGARIDRFVGLLRRKGAMVYWVGLPKMRKDSYDQDVAALDDFFASRMTALGAPFFPTRSLSSDDAGAFNLYLPDPVTKAPRLMRANDGVHMTPAGYERLAGPLIDRIRADLARARGPSLAAPPPAPPPSGPPKTATAGS